jgi:hypothetical protein
LALLGGGLAWVLGGCGGDAPPGSTLARSLVDPDGDGLLAPGPGVPLRDRTDLGGGGRPQRVLASLAQLTDPHVRDAQSPARVPFLDRLGPRFGGAFVPTRRSRRSCWRRPCARSTIGARPTPCW